MQPQLVCGKASSTCVTIPHSVIVFPTTDSSHVSVVGCSRFPRAMRRQMNWQIRLANYGVLSLRGRHSMLTRFAALSGNEAVELERFGSKGNLNGESGLRGQEGLVFSVGTSAPSPMSFREWYMADKQLVVISFSAFVTTGFMAILLAAAIPSLLAIKKAAESLEKLADTARMELPGTMAAIRLSGMEISDLTMELNDLGQEISRGVRNSTRALSVAEAGMRQIGGLANNVWQERAVVPAQAMQPLVARTARQVRESLVQTRVLVHNLQVLSRVSSWLGSLPSRTPALIIPSQKKGN
ncbi:uncharacterized protein [Physcomitrium patens]|uniref:Uncharacterized protein n=1 Tax=Physcomitrium patens TaxID=3218 RepID=A0A2K1IXE4_PHYPA|nr:uncharacterized protein LOC112272856 isoform X1 [Physcomitrium patens]XP_024356784.1 uncharacterized protein LOC112272856 isoform X1 [Physcomitrium patens]XP_024356785.1 uncharacterized protein LOC112272856 isoform X1 [Physcomitrium patens]PNR33946.1 hypothetical protein PHYPA_023762 [Physcomitrium patens]|eukprot:XP_024356783.1 uncharacterized protein LOC112272856 isoform X1 [Physcomitrella patens]